MVIHHLKIIFIKGLLRKIQDFFIPYTYFNNSNMKLNRLFSKYIVFLSSNIN